MESVFLMFEIGIYKTCFNMPQNIELSRKALYILWTQDLRYRWGSVLCISGFFGVIETRGRNFFFQYMYYVTAVPKKNCPVQLLFREILIMSFFQIEEKLRKESFGYRAKFIQRSAAEIEEKGGLEWFNKIQQMDYKNAHTELVTLTGIGPKVNIQEQI